MSETRRLGTIVFADIAGYTALMQDDEVKALRFLEGFKKVAEAETMRFQGRLVQYFGDACLLSFDSSTNAMNCALAMHLGFRHENDIPVRIGIHLGEVVYTESNAFGDGVNIASRIESLGVPGSILISREVRDQVKNKPEFNLVSLGYFDFKNVKESMEVFAVANPGIMVPAREQMQGKLQDKKRKVLPRWLMLTAVIIILVLIGLLAYTRYWPGANGDRNKAEKSIAVLPFRNDSPDEANVYFCNGIMEGVLDNLAKIPGLSVVSRTSVEQYRTTPPPTKEIAKQLGVNYILEGSVLRIDDRCIIRAQLIYAPEDRHLWSDQYDKELEDVFSVLAEVTRNIADNLKATISPQVLINIENEPTTDLTAYDYYLQGKEYLNNYDLTGHAETLADADRLFKIALRRDPSFAQAYVGHARVFIAQHQLDFYMNDDLVDSVIFLCDKAIKLDPAAADAYWIRGSFYDDFLFDIPEAVKDLNKALEINPNHIGAIRQLAYLYRLHYKDYITSFKLLKTLEKLERSFNELSLTYTNFAALYFDIGEWEKGHSYLNKAVDMNPNYVTTRSWYYTVQGRIQDCIDILLTYDTDNQWIKARLGLSYMLIKDYQKALAYYKEWALSVEKYGPDSWEGVKDWHRYGQVLYYTGNEEAGLKLMNDQLLENEKLLTNFQGAHKVYYNNAGIYSFMGNKKMALKYLRKFDETNRWEEYIYFIQIDPLFDNIRGEEEFRTIVSHELEENRKIREDLDLVEASSKI